MGKNKYDGVGRDELLQEINQLKAAEKLMRRHLEEALGHLVMDNGPIQEFHDEAMQDLIRPVEQLGAEYTAWREKRQTAIAAFQKEANDNYRNEVIEECAKSIDASIFEPLALGAETKRRCAARIRQLKQK